MNTPIRIAIHAIALAAISCSSAPPPEAPEANAPQAASEAASKPASKTGAGDPHAVFGPLEVGADWQGYAKLNTEPVESEDHGGRFVDTYVNDIGVAAYKDESADIPVGTIVVKVSWERDGDEPSNRQGPIFVMEKKTAGYDPENDDWYYAIHWAEPTAKMRERFGQIYWRSPSPKVGYCLDCHNGYDRQLGMIPEGKRAW